jgi:hypothetical protein
MKKNCNHLAVRCLSTINKNQGQRDKVNSQKQKITISTYICVLLFVFLVVGAGTIVSVKHLIKIN